jgi:ABC-type nickel/cobalt efflux system permease component RcnA
MNIERVPPLVQIMVAVLITVPLKYLNLRLMYPNGYTALIITGGVYLFISFGCWLIYSYLDGKLSKETIVVRNRETTREKIEKLF